MDIKEIETYKLVEELSKREGVEVIDVLPYEEKNIKVSGPCLILNIID